MNKPEIAIDIKGAPRDRVVEITLPDGKHWFYGLASVQMGQNQEFVMNDWRSIFTQLEYGKGIFSFEEAIAAVSAISMDGVDIKYHRDVKKEVENG